MSKDKKSLVTVGGITGWMQDVTAVLRSAAALLAPWLVPLAPAAFFGLAIWETEYCQILEGENPVAEFVKGTQLKRFLDALDEPERSEFEDEYRKRIHAAYPKRLDGKTLFPFRRIFILAGL